MVLMKITLFFEEKNNSIIDTFGNELYIVCGDFNLVMNPDIDFQHVKIGNPKSRHIF